MANIFWDTNILLRLMEDDLPSGSKAKLNKHASYISVLSIHIAAYVHKIKMPSDRFNNLLNHFTILSLTNAVINQSLQKPTTDFEDNIQLNTALKNNIQTFVTLDKELLKIKSYRGMKIVSPQDL
jgi:predicted nucleic acid-binding protein